MPKGNKRNNKLPIRPGTLLIIAVMLMVLSVGGVVAKYVYETGGENLLSAKELYFTSDLLREEPVKYVLNSTATEVSFSLRNSADKLRVSQVDIPYSVSVKTKNGGAAPKIVYKDTSRILPGNKVSETTISLQNLQIGETYIVKVVGKKGYEQTLTAEFAVSDKDEYIYMHIDTSDPAYVLLTVWTDNLAGDLNVSIPAGLIPDNTNPILKDVFNYQDKHYNAVNFTDSTNFKKPYSSYSYRFFHYGLGGAELDEIKVSITVGDTTYSANKVDELK